VSETRILKYYGSKERIARHIADLMPAHRTYLEPFLGSGSVFFAKPPSLYEVLNDLDGDVVNLFRVIRENAKALSMAIEATPWARDEYAACKLPSEDPIEQARRYLVRCWQAWGGTYGAGWSRDIGKRTTSQTHTWSLLPERLVVVAERLKNAYIENRPAVKLIQEFDAIDTLIYADPPYVTNSRSSTRGYRYDMTVDDHIELLAVLRLHSGPVLISGYSHELYDETLSGWRRVVLKGTTQKNAPRDEVVWINPTAVGLLGNDAPLLNAEVST
jgi:DNA adenine methylase